MHKHRQIHNTYNNKNKENHTLLISNSKHQAVQSTRRQREMAKQNVVVMMKFHPHASKTPIGLVLMAIVYFLRGCAGF